MQHEMQTDEGRRFGAQLARDVERDEDHSDDANRPDLGARLSPRFSFLRGVAFSRGV
jgi:hypothetical protein